MSRTEARYAVCVVSPEALWPSTHGGRVRTAHLVEEIAAQHSVVVVSPDRPDTPQSDAPAGIDERRVGFSGRVRQRHRLSPQPLLGRYFAEPLISTLKQMHTEGTRCFLWSHSYMAAIGMQHLPDANHIVDFANIEGHRFTSMADGRKFGKSLPLRLEALKAKQWEPRVARFAKFCLALSSRDLAVISAWGGRTLLVKNGMRDLYAGTSGQSETILAVANWNYEPNRAAIKKFVADDWPSLTVRRPHARLVIVGRGSNDLDPAKQVERLGFVEDLGGLYAQSAVCLALAAGGAGSQLKVVDGLSHGRVIVGPPFLEGELQLGSPAGTIVPSANMVDAICALLEDPSSRHELEASLADYVVKHSWSAEAAALMSVVAQEASP